MLKVVMKTWVSKVLTTILYPIYHTSIYSSILLSTCNWFFIIGNHLLWIVTLVMSFLSWYCHVEVWPPLVVILLNIIFGYYPHMQFLESFEICSWSILFPFYETICFMVIYPPHNFHAFSSHNAVYRSVYIYIIIYDKEVLLKNEFHAPFKLKAWPMYSSLHRN